MDPTWQNASPLNRPVSPETIQLLVAAEMVYGSLAGPFSGMDGPRAGPDIPPEGEDGVAVVPGATWRRSLSR